MGIYYYTVNKDPAYSVDTDSADFIDKVNWLLRESPADSYIIMEYTGYDTVGGEGAHVRALADFRDSTKPSLYSHIDCYLLSKSPDVALPEIYNHLQYPLPTVLPKYHPPNDSVDPVGPPWPAKGSGIWMVSKDFNATTWPVKSTFTKLSADGITRTFYRTTVRGSAGAATIFGGSTYVPAWADKPMP